MWLRSILFQVGFILWTGAISLATLPFLLLPRRLHVPVVQLWARWSLAWLKITCAVDCEIRGHPPEGIALIASRHQSAWETIFYAAAIRDPAYVLKRELFRIPLFGWHLWRAGNIGVDRSGHARTLKTMLRQAAAVVREGRRIIIFPEGTRTPPGAERTYHPGVTALYRSLGLEVVPVALNSGLYWPRRKLLKRPGTIIVEFLPPIAPGLAREVFEAELKSRIDTATARLVAEGRTTLA
jgi:1-acyl-sn-glycerol-3-phosphate acyltransferase